MSVRAGRHREESSPARTCSERGDSETPAETSVAGETQYKTSSRSHPTNLVRNGALLQMRQAQQAPRRRARTTAAIVEHLEDVDLLSFLAGNSQLVAARIDRASSVAELAVAAGGIEGRARMLHRRASRSKSSPKSSPTSIGACWRAVRALVASPAIPTTTAPPSSSAARTRRADFFAPMRKTIDLIFFSGRAPDDELQTFRAVSAALRDAAFPPSGNVMVVNPLWSKTINKLSRASAVGSPCRTNTASEHGEGGGSAPGDWCCAKRKSE